jgi:hypothetical protein
MQQQFELLKTSRERLLQLVEGLSIEQILHRPDGCNNHLGWNFCHVLATQQLLTYGLAAQPFVFEQSVIDTFRKGTKGEDNISSEFWSTMKEMAIATSVRLEADYQAGLFNSFRAYDTSFGYHLSSIEDAIIFNNVHEGLHLGYMMCQKRLLSL